MTWTKLLHNGDAQRHSTSKQELDNLRALIARDLTDAAVTQISADRRYATAYNAALQASHMAIACAGYRLTSKTGHHRVAFEGVVLAIGAPVSRFADYFDICRRKRNKIDYTQSRLATETEAKEILTEAAEFVDIVEQWISKNHPKLAK